MNPRHLTPAAQDLSQGADRTVLGPDASRRTSLVDFALSRHLLELAVPVALAGTAIRWRLMNASLILNHFADRTIGISVARHIDVAQRTRLLFEALALLLGMTGLCLAATWLVARVLGRRWPSSLRRIRGALAPAHAMGAITIAALLFVPPTPESVGWVSTLLNGVALATLLASLRAFPRLSVSRGLSPVALNLALTTASWALAYTFVVEYMHRPALSLSLFVAGWGVTLPALLLLPRLVPHPRRLLIAALPFVIMPLIGFFAQEIGYAIFLRGGGTPTFRSLVGWLLCILAVAGLALGLFSQKTSWRLWPASRMWSRGVLPLALIGLAVVVAWVPAGSPYQLDLFHDGESALPAHQLFRFGAWPYLDIFPTHGLILSYLGGVVHWMLDGFVSGDAKIGLGRPLLYAVGGVSLYFLVRRVSASNLLAAFVVAVLPAPAVGAEYGFALLGLLALGTATAQGTRRAYARLGLALLAVVLFRIDSGLMLIAVASVMVVTIELSRLRTRRGALLADVLCPTVAPLALAVSGFAIALLVSRPNGWATLSVIREYLSLTFQSMSQGLPDLFSDRVSRPASHMALFFLPAISVILAGSLALHQLRSVSRGGHWIARDVILIALTGYNILVLTRALARHTEGEAGSVAGFSSAYSSVLVILLATRLAHKSRTFLSGVVAVLVVLQVLSGLPASGMLRDAMSAPARPSIERPARLSALSPRFPQPFWEAPFEMMRGFSESRLGPTGTFLDLSHEPLLYVALDRRFPGYIIPVLYASSERTQRLLVEQASHAATQFAVKLNSNWWSHVDLICDSMRSYRVHEFAATTFPVALSVGPFQVLSAEGARTMEDSPTLPVALPPPTATKHDLSMRSTRRGLLLTAGRDDPNVEIATPRLVLAAGQSMAVNFVLTAEHSGAAQVYFARVGEAFSEILSTPFQIKPGSERTRYRVVSPPFPTGSIIDRIRFDPPDAQNVLIERLSVASTAAFPRIDPSELAEVCEVGKLPWLWARYDPLRALERQGVEWDLVPALRTALRASAGEPLVLAPHSTIAMRGASWDSRTAGYLHLSARATDPGSLAVRYSKEEGGAQSGFGFDLVEGKNEYMVRVSGQWSWLGDRRPVEAFYLENRSEKPVEILAFDSRTAD
jgi:hypothetical protein